MISNNIIHIAKYLGANFAYVQGAGGNVSEKISEQWMAIKASGCELQNINPSQGFCIVDCERIALSLRNRQIQNDNQASAFGLEVRHPKTSSNRPSMEYGFHALLDRFVIHSHPVYINVLLCSSQANEIITSMFPDAIYIPYVTPGINLTYEIMEHLKNNQSSILFLQNHGLIVHHSSFDELIKLHEEVNAKVQGHFKLQSFDESWHAWDDYDAMNGNVLFPDQVIFTQDRKVYDSVKGIQMRRVYSYIWEQLKFLGLKASKLSPTDVDILKTMESEKYRLNKRD